MRDEAISAIGTGLPGKGSECNGGDTDNRGGLNFIQDGERKRIKIDEGENRGGDGGSEERMPLCGTAGEAPELRLCKLA
jgi:hypothetical protein